LKAAGTTDYHTTGQTITVEKPSITSVTPNAVDATAATTLTFAGFGLDSNIKIKVIASSASCNADNSDTSNVLTGGDGFTLGSNNARTIQATKSVTLNTATENLAGNAAKVCVLIPTTSSGNANYEDTALEIEVRGTARNLVVQTNGYGFLAGSSPTAATTPFVVKIVDAGGNTVTTDEQHGVTQIVATVTTTPTTHSFGSDTPVLGGTTTLATTSVSGVTTWTDLTIDLWGGRTSNLASDGYKLTFTATTLSGTTMTSTTVVSSAFVVGGIAKKVIFDTEPAGCVAAAACTTQPVVRVVDAGNTNVPDKYSGIQTVTITIQTDTSCDHSSQTLYSGWQIAGSITHIWAAGGGSAQLASTEGTTDVSAGTTCTVSNSVCTFSGLTFKYWAIDIVLRFTATMPTATVHTMTNGGDDNQYVDTSALTVKGNAAKIALVFDSTDWVSGWDCQYTGYTNGHPQVTCPSIEAHDASDNALYKMCVHGVTRVTATITSTHTPAPSLSGAVTQLHRNGATKYFDYFRVDQHAKDLELTFTATAPTHFADMTTTTIVTSTFDVYKLFYRRTITLTPHKYEFSNNDEGTNSPATP
jgi:hypothetical protein